MTTKHKIIVACAATIGILSAGSSVWLATNAQAFYVPAGSMEPTLPINSRVLGLMHAYDSAAPQRGDIALIELPISLVSPGSGSGTTTFVKRVVGVPGDKIEIKGRVLLLNGKPQSEPFIVPPPKDGYFYDMKVRGGKVFSREMGADYPWTIAGLLVASESEQEKLSSSPTQAIPPDKFLVLGDNRGNSNDSHVFGLIKRSAFKGRVGFQYWPRVRSF